MNSKDPSEPPRVAEDSVLQTAAVFIKLDGLLYSELQRGCVEACDMHGESSAVTSPSSENLIERRCWRLEAKMVTGLLAARVPPASDRRSPSSRCRARDDAGPYSASCHITSQRDIIAVSAPPARLNCNIFLTSLCTGVTGHAAAVPSAKESVKRPAAYQTKRTLRLVHTGTVCAQNSSPAGSANFLRVSRHVSGRFTT